MTTDTPTLNDITQLAEDWGLAGDKSTMLVIFLSMLKGGFVVITGRSSGGKDANVNAAEFCVPDSWVYPIPTSLSQTALYENAQEINSHPVHRHKDISNISGKDWLEDIWKRHGDGNPISHEYNDVTGGERTTVTQTLYPPNCMILFLAKDNQQVDLNDYPEVRNRALIVSVDDSQSLTEEVNTRQAKQEAGTVDHNMSRDEAQSIRDYVGSIPIASYGGDDGPGSFLNPVMPALDAQNPLPQHFPEARRDFPRLSDFMKAVTLFHYDERIEVPNSMFGGGVRVDAETTMLVTPSDAWLGMRVFGEQMVLSALNLQDQDFALLDLLRNAGGQQFDAGTLQQMLRGRGFNVTDRDVRRSLDSMKTKGYVRVDKTASPHEWSASDFAQQISREVNLDWPSVIEDTREIVHENYPTPVAVDYEQRFLDGEGLLVTHPFDGTTVNLQEREANELEEAVEEQEDKEEDVFGNSVYDDSSQNTLR